MFSIILYVSSFLAIMAGTKMYCGKYILVKLTQAYIPCVCLCKWVSIHQLVYQFHDLSLPPDASCRVSEQTTQYQTLYNFSCTEPCSYWVLYLLDSSVPLGGRCSRLPCTLDTTSILKDAIAVYKSLNLVFRNWMTISSNGTLVMVAQCAYLASYKVPLVIRQGVMLRSESSSVDCSTTQPSIVPTPSSTVSSASLASDNPSTTFTTTAQANSVFLSSTPVMEQIQSGVINFRWRKASNLCMVLLLLLLVKALEAGPLQEALIMCVFSVERIIHRWVEYYSDMCFIQYFT